MNPLAHSELVIAAWNVAMCTHIWNHLITIKQLQILQMFAPNSFAQLELVIAVWTVAICTHVLNHFTTKLIKQLQILQMLATNPLVHSELVIAVWTVAVVYTCLESPHSETGSVVDAITDLTGMTQFRFRHGRKYTFVCRVWKVGFVRLPVQPPLFVSSF